MSSAGSCTGAGRCSVWRRGHVLAYVLGLSIGLIAGYRRSFVDPVLMRSVDVMLCFPPLLFLLVLIAGAGSSVAVMIIGVALVQAPQISRIVRTATSKCRFAVTWRQLSPAASGAPSVIFREVLPNILSPLLVDVGLRFTYSILIIASVNFLGLGLQPPNSDWALMIGENRSYLAVNASRCWLRRR